PQGTTIRGSFRCVEEPGREKFESNRNLFYVACSRPKVRLALLFTQLLSQAALAQITAWFGAEHVFELPADPG
ncbi:hypothetical protein GIV66_31455, partial [Pseudomonas sp. PA-3-11C]|nr:hypothetical protein [Pseudomonas sp. PA-3-11C]